MECTRDGRSARGGEKVNARPVDGPKYFAFSQPLIITFPCTVFLSLPRCIALFVYSLLFLIFKRARQFSFQLLSKTIALRSSDFIAIFSSRPPELRRISTRISSSALARAESFLDCAHSGHSGDVCFPGFPLFISPSLAERQLLSVKWRLIE